MIGLLPLLRWPGWRRMARNGAPGRARRPEAVGSPTDMAPPPPWLHRPPEPCLRAETCGQCSKPLTDTSPTLDFCSDVCRGTWARAQVGIFPPKPTPAKVTDEQTSGEAA